MNATVEDFLNEINEIAPLPIPNKQYEWHECFDELSGYYYYWNTKTDEVTWAKPDKYKSAKELELDKNLLHRNVNVPPRSGPLFPSTSRLTDTVKIYKITEENKLLNKIEVNNEEKRIVTWNNKHKIDSKDEKPVSDVKNPESTKSCNHFLNEPKISNVKHSLGYSLVAGYSDSDEEPEGEEVKNTFCPIQPPPPDSKIAHSTLFPVTQPIDVNDFKEPTHATEEINDKENEFDSKAFQRKRRIGVALINTSKRSKEQEVGDGEKAGLGFKKESPYTNFTKGGIMFEKSEDQSEDNKEDVENLYETLKEKLGFLSEGFNSPSPVHTMIIQADTLFTAMKSGDLKLSYLERWLNETCSNLINLEKDATPDGWLLQWDRSHKRYYYRNETTGESQWEYPQLDVVRRDEAMDLSTTPPPVDVNDDLSPPLPPVIRSPTPPPPPIISKDTEKTSSKEANFNENSEPLPPGVDTNESNPKESLDSALDSFYNDIAAIECTNSPTEQNIVEDTQKINEQASLELAKKKKKNKVKLTQGLAMKKKGVSKLVEKWKNVQLNYD